MTRLQQAQRNDAIVALWSAKAATKTELAERFNLSFVQIDRICKTARAKKEER